MLYSQPPGYQPSFMNKQTLGGLSTPGNQANALTLGNPQKAGAGPINPSSMLNGSPSLMNSGSSSFSQPSSQPSNMNQYFNSGNGNQSTLLRVLMGNKYG